MGCGGSKVDDSPLVKLCKERKDLIKAASDHRYALAAAHVAYFRSLRDVGNALGKFVDEELIIGSVASSPPDSPVLTLPSDEGKGKNRSSSSSTSISHSPDEIDEKEGIEDSHLHLSSDSEEDSSASHIHLHHLSPEQEEEVPSYYPSYNSEVPYYPNYNSYTTPWNPSGANSSYNTYYMRRSPTRPTVVYEDPRAYSTWQDPSYSTYPQYGHGGYFGSSMGTSYPDPDHNRKEGQPPAAPPAPPSPGVSAWDFLNIFSSYNAVGQDHFSDGRYGYGSTTSSPDSKEVRKREGIPDLEDETESERFKETRKGKKKRHHVNKNSRDGTSRAMASQYREGASRPMPSQYREGASRPTPSQYREGTSRPTPSQYRGGASRPTPSQYRESTSSPMPSQYGEGTSRAMSSQYMDGMSRAVPLQHGEGNSRTVPMQNSEATSNSQTQLDNEGIHSLDAEDVKSSPETIVTKSSEAYPRKKAVSFEVDRGSMKDNDSSKLSSLTTIFTQGTRDLKEAVQEVKDEFDAASGHGKEVSMLLQVGTLPYQSKGTAIKVIFSQVLYSIAPSMSSTNSNTGEAFRMASSAKKMAKAFYGDIGKDISARPSNLALILEKLYIWEKKLYTEVKDEERLRATYEKKCKRLKVLDYQGAESNKIEANQAATKKLLAKLNVNIITINAIAKRIHKLRDEELLPQLTQLIHGLIRMWKSLLKCHQNQLQAIADSKIRTLRANTKKQRESSLRATVELEMELLSWCNHFNTWIGTQKAYVKCLNGWLLRYLRHEPEETVDGIAPFSPGRIGAPPVFIICNDWFQAMERIVESTVADSMKDFALNLHQLWERQDEEQRQQIKAGYLLKDFEKQLRAYGVEQTKFKDKRNQEQEKIAASLAASDTGVSPLDDLKVDLDTIKSRLVEERARHKEAVKLVHDAASSSVQGGLIPIFEALGNFSSEVLKVHEQVRITSSVGS